MLSNIIEKAEKNNCLNKDEIVELLNSDGSLLYISSDRVRKNDCFYCGLRCENKEIDRYRLTDKEIINCVERTVKAGFGTVVLQGGEDIYYDTDKICSLIKKIKKYDVALTLSIGERTFEEYKAFKQAGADRYLLRIETTDKNLYRQLHPKMSYENRVNCLYSLKELGYETGTGSLAGLPNQTIQSLADDILFFKEYYY